jgi:hypothetical protein
VGISCLYGRVAAVAAVHDIALWHSSDRARLQEQVFQADHRLPTMSIDEYLEIERQRGNILTGGG